MTTKSVATNTGSHIYEHPDGRREIIRDGFSWSAFLFGPLWAWRRGMVSLGFVLLGLHLGLQLIPVLFIDLFGEAGIAVDLFFSVAVLVWIGTRGNEWSRQSVLDRGFRPTVAPLSARAQSTPSRARTR